MPVEEGRGGEEEVKVVARRVGLKRRDDGFGRKDQRSLTCWCSKSVDIPFFAKSNHNHGDLPTWPFECHLNFR